MVNIKYELAGKIEAHVPEMDADGIAGWLEVPPNRELGDLSLPCFRLSKRLRKPPQQIADELKEKLRDELIERIDSVSGYLNITLNQSVLASRLIPAIIQQGEQYGAQDLGRGRTVVFDYSSPNIAKPFHIAHLRSTVIGNALVQIFNFLGYRTVGINHLGDWGTQFGKLIVAYRRWGSREEIERLGIDKLLLPDHAAQWPETHRPGSARESIGNV